MTTYLATHTRNADNPGAAEKCTRAFCSDQHRKSYMWNPREFELRDDPSYEFDETCANCGKLIPASALVTCPDCDGQYVATWVYDGCDDVGGSSHDQGYQCVECGYKWSVPTSVG